MSRVLPPPEDVEESRRQSVDLPVRLWEEVERVAKAESSARGQHITKAMVLRWLLEYALREYRAEQSEHPPRRS